MDSQDKKVWIRRGLQAILGMPTRGIPNGRNFCSLIASIQFVLAIPSLMEQLHRASNGTIYGISELHGLSHYVSAANALASVVDAMRLGTNKKVVESVSELAHVFRNWPTIFLPPHKVTELAVFRNPDDGDDPPPAAPTTHSQDKLTTSDLSKNDKKTGSVPINTADAQRSPAPEHNDYRDHVIHHATDATEIVSKFLTCLSYTNYFQLQYDEHMCNETNNAVREGAIFDEFVVNTTADPTPCPETLRVGDHKLTAVLYNSVGYHYTCARWDPCRGEWLYFDDSSVDHLGSDEQFMNKIEKIKKGYGRITIAVMLFYLKRS